jgi:hypothetical protein
VREWSEILHKNKWYKPTSKEYIYLEKYFQKTKPQWNPNIDETINDWYFDGPSKVAQMAQKDLK